MTQKGTLDLLVAVSAEFALKVVVQEALLENADLLNIIHQSIGLIDSLHKVLNTLTVLDSALESNCKRPPSVLSDPYVPRFIRIETHL